ncbi:NUDIX domain-containing protein [Variovorax sp. dw_954]|uniref:NUDIX hydrolase n=1 Tax=Variovorax sp. dw_954 TaxID=2720078 RepID=UPI001BD1D428|nr:NUDIX domain-containing protein [Variovorax sp. dw_954]
MAKLLFPLVSADVAIFSIGDGALQVLLVQRARAPAAGAWALPGAVLNPEIDRDLEATARRALRDKISVEVPYLSQLHTFAGADRDPRGWSLGVLHYALLPRNRVQAVVRSNVEVVQWADADAALPPLAFDHAEQLAAARSALRERVREHALPLHLMPEQFTLTQLQKACEIILAHGPDDVAVLDKGAFRRRFAKSADIVEIPGAFERGAQRPAQLFKVAPGFRF